MTYEARNFAPGNWPTKRCLMVQWSWVIACYCQDLPGFLSNQRKLRGQTSDNMERWNAEKRRVEEKSGREKEKELEERRYRCAKCRKVGLLKRRVRSYVARWEMKNWTPLWRKACFQVKMCKTPQLRTIFGSSAVEKWHAIVARSTFPSQNVQNTPCSEHSRSTFGSWDVEKWHAVVARSTFPSQNV